MTTEELAVEIDHDDALETHISWLKINRPEFREERVAWVDRMEKKCSVDDLERIAAIRFNIETTRARRKEIGRRVHLRLGRAELLWALDHSSPSQWDHVENAAIDRLLSTAGYARKK